MADCSFNSASETTADFIYRYRSQQQIIGSPEDTPCMDFVSTDFNVIYIPLDTVEPISLRWTSYYSTLGLYTPLDSSSMEASDILSTHSPPALGSQGRGVLIGIIDTGIDYTNPPFRNPDGITRINSIWDQNLPEDKTLIPPGVPNRYNISGATHGTEYTRKQTNQALESDDPLALVPSTDTNEHGTFLAGIAAGGFLPEEDFTEATPECELLIVRLKPVRQHLRDFHLVSSDTDAYQENDVMVGIEYLRVEVFSRGKPLVILLDIGSNLDSHGGTSPLGVTLQDTSRHLGTTTVIVAGNETRWGYHYMGITPTGESSADVEIRAGQSGPQRRFVVKSQASTIDTYSVGFLFPSGKTISRIPIIVRNETSIFPLLEPTAVIANYQLIEAGLGRQLVFMRFEVPTIRVWKICVYNTQFLTGQFNMWLPTHNLISEETMFLTPSPYTTITFPGNAPLPTIVGAYSHLNNSIYIHPSHGYTVGGLIKSDLTAPDVDASGPAIGRRIGTSVLMTTRTGISVAAVHVTGTAANLLGWGIAEGNNITMSEVSIKAYLTRGVRRNPALPYPNREWGYGVLNLCETFLWLRE